MDIERGSRRTGIEPRMIKQDDIGAALLAKVIGGRE
jgi:hypothetical protein